MAKINLIKIKQLLLNELKSKGKRELCRDLKISAPSLYNYTVIVGTVPKLQTVERFAKYFIKPITYFFDEEDIQDIPVSFESVDPMEKELIRLFRELKTEHHRQRAIDDLAERVDTDRFQRGESGGDTPEGRFDRGQKGGKSGGKIRMVRRRG